jgi:hypothetical protein
MLSVAVLDHVPVLARDCLIAHVIKNKATPELTNYKLLHCHRAIGTGKGKYVHSLDCYVCYAAIFVCFDRMQTHAKVLLRENFEVLVVLISFNF